MLARCFGRGAEQLCGSFDTWQSPIPTMRLVICVRSDGTGEVVVIPSGLFIAHSVMLEISAGQGTDYRERREYL